MRTSEQIDKLFPAIVAAQHAAEIANKDAENPHYRSKYADLQSVWEAVSKALSANDLAVIQAPGLVEEGKLFITTRIIHKSGQWLETEASTPLPKADPQGYGSAVTYMRRYTLAALLGVVSGEDDDGNGASLGTQGKQTGKAPPKNPKAQSTEGEPVHGMALTVTAKDKKTAQSGKPYYIITGKDSQGELYEVRVIGAAMKYSDQAEVGQPVTIDGKWAEYQGKTYILADVLAGRVAA